MSKAAPSLQDLVRMEKHPYYYVNPISGKITYRRTHNSVTITIRTGLTKIGEAKSFVEAELERRRTGASIASAKRTLSGVHDPLIDEAWDDFYESETVGKAVNTATNYRKAWNYGLKGYWAGNTVSAFKDLRKISGYKKWYLDENPERVYIQTDAVFKVYLRFLVKHKYLTEFPDLSPLNDLDEIVRSNIQYLKPGRVYTPKEREKLLSAWKQILEGRVGGATPEVSRKMIAARARLGILLGLKRGLRINEIVTLPWEKIDLKRKVLLVWSTKNKKHREIKIDTELEEAIKFQSEANAHLKSAFVFPMPTKPSRHISKQVFEKAWYRARDFAGVIPRQKYDACFHDCRKTCATMTAELGWPVKVACEMLDMSITVYEKIYANKVGVDAQEKWLAKTFGGGE